jgi:two-component system C4-dicarboxylate transport response regulator DctD
MRRLEHDSVPRVILAEDDDALRATLVEELIALGYEVQVATNGLELTDAVLEAVQGRLPVPDAIISDVRMPGATGVEVLELLRRYDWRVPVVLTTAFPDHELSVEALRLGACELLEKPLDLLHFRQAVARAVS